MNESVVMKTFQKELQKKTESPSLELESQTAAASPSELASPMFQQCDRDDDEGDEASASTGGRGKGRGRGGRGGSKRSGQQGRGLSGKKQKVSRNSSSAAPEELRPYTNERPTMFVEDLVYCIQWALPDPASLNSADVVRMHGIRDNALRVGLEFAFTKRVRVAGEDHTVWSTLRPALKAMVANASGAGGAADLVSVSTEQAKEGLCNILRRLGSEKQGFTNL
jgi:hypothetical protein